MAGRTQRRKNGERKLRVERDYTFGGYAIEEWSDEHGRWIPAQEWDERRKEWVSAHAPTRARAVKKAKKLQKERKNPRGRGRMLDYGTQKSGSREGRMLKLQLTSMEREARKLRSILEDGDDLPQWIHSKVSTAGDRLTTASQYLQSKLEYMDDE
jgi:hypothetical protein